MSLELANIIRETCGSLATIAESIEKAIETIIRTSGTISAGFKKIHFRKIADALATFYFTPIGIRRDVENYINKPSHDNLQALEIRLEKNHEIVRKFGEFVYRDMDSNLFQLPLQNIEHLFNVKSKLHSAIYDFRYELETLSMNERQIYLHEITLSFDAFNKKLEETIKSLHNFTS